jgi:hypothetical protein
MLLPPLVVPKWGCIKRIANSSPVGQMLIQERNETLIVTWTYEVGHLVEHNVFEAFGRLLG